MAKWFARTAVALLIAGIFSCIALGQSRPQDEAVARGPRPYTDQEVSFPSDGADGGQVKLAGTLSVPNGTGPFPAVALIAAAGPMDRDENVEGHRVFVVLADHLLRKHIAVLRYDKRGVGASTGNEANGTFADRVDDAHAAFRYLASRPEIDPHRVGLIGHSEGGSIGPAVASVDHDVAFIVAMAGSGLSGELRITEHEVYLAEQDGASPTQQAGVRALCKQIFRTVAKTTDDATAGAQISALIDTAVADKLIKKDQEREIRDLMTARFVREELTDFPLDYLKRVTVPVLALVGSLDRIVPAGPYVQVMQPVLATIPGSKLEVLPNLNHVMQTSKTGSPDEFGTIEESISPLALRIIGDWIAKQPQSAINPLASTGNLAR